LNHEKDTNHADKEGTSNSMVICIHALVIHLKLRKDLILTFLLKNRHLTKFVKDLQALSLH
jgi:hypothetical protein